MNVPGKPVNYDTFKYNLLVKNPLYSFLVNFMVFNSNAGLPARIKTQFPSQRAQSVFRKTFNNIFRRTKDESSAFRIATSAAKKAMKKKMQKNMAKNMLELSLIRLEGIKKADINGNATVELRLNKGLTLIEELSDSDDLIIRGIALQEGTFKNVFYSAEVLEKMAPSLIGKPLRFDHLQGVADIAGKVIEATFDKAKRAIIFAARVFDLKAIRLLKEKLVNAVSVGAIVDVVSGKKGPEANGGKFRELSLTEDPACKTCKIKTIEDTK